MHVIVLAAGQGTRLRPLTDDIPKCLVQIKGKSFLERQLSQLRRAGLSKFSIVTGYRSETIESMGFKTIRNSRYAETNMLASLMEARSILCDKEDVLVTYGDIVFDSRVSERLRPSYQNITLPINTQWESLWRLRMDDPLEDAETLKVGKNGKLLEIGKTPKSIDEVQGQYMGLIVLPKGHQSRWVRAFDELEKGQQETLSITPFLQHLVEAGETIQTTPVLGGWLEIDSVKDLEVYEGMEGNRELAPFCKIDE